MAKKRSSSSKKRKRAPSGVDPNERRRERLEARRRAKAEAVAAQRRAERRARLIRFAFYGALFAVAVWFFFLRGAEPTEIRGHEITEFGEGGVNEHVEGTVNYEQSPPVSGPHAPAPAACGSHGQPVPNENLVHSLEHGAVAVLYSADVDVEQIRTMEALAGDNVLVAPYEGEMETPISAASWGRRMDLEELDEAAIQEYIDEFAGEGPEAGQECPGEADEQFQPADAETPEGEEAPEGDEGADETPES